MDPVTALPHFDHFETERAGPVAVWRINRPSKANALTAALWPQLRGLLDAAAAQPGVRAVVLTGSGDRAFSAGGDIEAFAELDGAAARHGAGRRAAAFGLPEVHLAGVVRVAGRRVAGGRVITDRLGLLRRLTAGDYRGSPPGENTAGDYRGSSLGENTAGP